MRRRSRVFSALLLITVLFGLMGFQAHADNADLILPEDLEVIEECAFYGDTSLDSVHLGDKVRRIESKAFANSSVNRVFLPDSLEYIANDAFPKDQNVVFYAHRDSMGYTWAEDSGFTVIDPRDGFPESEHPYANNTDQTWTYIHPFDVSALLVTFSKETSIENGYDTLTVTDSDGNSNEYTGKELTGATIRIPGSSFTLHLVSDSLVAEYGFRITKIEEERESAYPESEHPYASNTDQTWTYIHPTDADALIVNFSPFTCFENGYDFLEVTDANGNTASYTGSELADAPLVLPGNHFSLRLVSDWDGNDYGFRISSISGVKRSSSLPESDHPYADDTDRWWWYIHPTNAEALKVTFSLDSELEDGFDTLTFMDVLGNRISYTGTQLSGLVLVLPGNSFSLCLQTDGSVIKNGFRIESIEEAEMPLSPDPERASFRALVVGNNNYTDSPLSGCISDAHSLGNMLAQLPNAYTVTNLDDATADGMKEGIETAFAGATADDVSLFYYSGHGLGDSDSVWNGALCGVDNSFLKTGELAQALSRVPGRVIVLLDCCHSGAAIGKGTENQRKAAEAFNQSVIEAFAKYDKPLPPSQGAKSGELAAHKFVVITACKGYEFSNEDFVDTSDSRHGVFTYFFLEGCGCSYGSGTYSGSMPADQNTDNLLTVMEIFNYTAAKTREWKQNAQCYAYNMYEVMFRR